MDREEKYKDEPGDLEAAEMWAGREHETGCRGRDGSRRYPERVDKRQLWNWSAVFVKCPEGWEK